jgi:hypothetical protein
LILGLDRLLALLRRREETTEEPAAAARDDDVSVRIDAARTRLREEIPPRGDED